MANGHVQCWGNGDSGIAEVPGLAGSVTALAVGEDQTCALVGGGVQCWGWNGYGQLGTGSTSEDYSSVPVSVSALPSGVAAVASGGDHTCVIVNGGVECWGWNGYGQLGSDATTGGFSPLPVAVAAITVGATAIAAGGEHSCAVLDGGAVCWGWNGSGQLGSTIDLGDYTSVPVHVTGLASGVGAIVAGEFHSCAQVGGGVQCWGSNSYGQLGNGYTIQSADPVPVVKLPQGTIEAVTAGGYHTCVLIDGGVQCWGRNDFGQLGDGSTIARSSPVQVYGLTSGVTAVAASEFHTCAVVKSEIQCWGANGEDELGNGSVLNSSLPIPVE